MNRLFRNWLACVGIVMAAAAVGLGSCKCLFAQEAEQSEKSVKIEPYTGPPIYLEEPEQVVEPSIVRHETMREPREGPVRIEREIALFSDNHFEADGAYREHYPNGKLFVEGRFKRGRQNGDWTFYHDNGQLNRKAIYKDGKPDGPREIFRADGTLWAKRGFRDGQRDGEWITYDETGQKPLAEEHYDNGKPEGVWKYWYPNGQLKQQITLKQGQRHGVSTDWDDKGEKRFEATFAEGKLHGDVTRWFTGGRKITQKYDEGRLMSQSSR
jgi:antitoxin component YwqK of YwqJK toxin-antitoxin module